MSIELFEKISSKNNDNSKIKLNLNTSFLKNIIIPFSSIIKREKFSDLYFGNEKIPFEERDPLFKSILRKEFSDAIKDFYKKKNKTGCE